MKVQSYSFQSLYVKDWKKKTQTFLCQTEFNLILRNQWTD